jgi:hypothetical protein
MHGPVNVKVCLIVYDLYTSIGDSLSPILALSPQKREW